MMKLSNDICLGNSQDGGNLMNFLNEQLCIPLDRLLRQRRPSHRQRPVIDFATPLRRVIASVMLILSSGLVDAQNLKSTYPRIGAIEVAGTNRVVDPEYRQALARHDIVVMGFWRDWSGTDMASNDQWTTRDVVVDIKRRAAGLGNSGILLGKYTMFMESFSEPSSSSSSFDKWNKLSSEVGPGYPSNNDWWARNALGQNVSSYPGNWNTNITEFVQRDINGDTYPEWSISRDYELYFKDIPEFDIWYIDNWFYKPRVVADWDGNGTDDSTNSESTRRSYRKGYVNALRRVRQLAPDRIVMGNVDGDPMSENGMLNEAEYKGQVASLFEGAMGKSWSIETWGSWEQMMRQYQTTLGNSRNRLHVLSVHGQPTDYALMRYGLASCLMDDGYYYYTTIDTEYRSALWFDEYDVDLGRAIDPPQFSPWQKGVYRRRFENGMVLVNPKGNGTRTLEIESGYSKIAGAQDSTVNNGQPVSSLVLPERDGIVLVRTGGAGEIKRPKAPVLY
jgi:hypothetical protein